MFTTHLHACSSEQFEAPHWKRYQASPLADIEADCTLRPMSTIAEVGYTYTYIYGNQLNCVYIYMCVETSRNTHASGSKRHLVYTKILTLESRYR